MTADEIAEVLRTLSPRWASIERSRALTPFAELYERNGVLADGFAPALQHSYPCAADCWQAAQHRLQPVAAR